MLSEMAKKQGKICLEYDLLTEMIEIRKYLKKGVVFQLSLANVHFMLTWELKNESEHMRKK